MWIEVTDLPDLNPGDTGYFLMSGYFRTADDWYNGHLLCNQVYKESGGVLYDDVCVRLT